MSVPQADGGKAMWLVGNVPLPEPSLVGIAAGTWLHRIRPWALPGPRYAHRLVGWPLIAAGTYVVVRSLAAAGPVDLTHPDRLVTSGPYAASRNPMYVGWALMHLGAGVAGGSAWIVAGLPAAAGWMHRQTTQEEQALAEEFGEVYGRYRVSVPRYRARQLWPGVRLLRDRRGACSHRYVAGGTGMYAAVADDFLLHHVRRLAGGARRVTSVCSGAFVLAAAGLLDGRRASTHWAACDLLDTKTCGYGSPETMNRTFRRRLNASQPITATTSAATQGPDLILARRASC